MAMAMAQCQYSRCDVADPMRLYAYEGDDYCADHFAAMAGREPTDADRVG